MNITMIPLTDLKPNPKNVRLHSAKQLSEYKRSVEKFGQTKAIVCDETKTILIGNGLYEAMKSLGMTEAACFIKTGMSENDKLKMMMADNKIYSLGVDNLEMIEGIIAQFGEAKDFDIPGFDADLLETLTFDAVGADDFMGNYGILDSETKDDMKRAAARYEEEEAEFVASADELTPIYQGNPLEGQENDQQTQTDIGAGLRENTEGTAGTALQRRFLVCPKCGEKIWL